ncbi:MAG: DUF86 domain-containing protein [Polyangiaceae bacterium]|nr:DUF86 domain-containing protein [Polyangiaceae bacterium]MCE7890972.1 DUF86 domain-containing protein [Sorangiineae bacterium PRO1]MCL4754629.1 DUF86 domain-containing protein [Myxococcales bacterium]
MGETQLELLERLLARLEQYAEHVTRAELESDLDTWLKVTRALELVAQCCVDLAMELVAKRGLGIPETYRDAFVRLAQDGLLTAEQSVALQGWAGLRNVLAHLYTSIDLDRLHAAMIEDKEVLRALGRLAARELSD